MANFNNYFRFRDQFASLRKKNRIELKELQHMEHKPKTISLSYNFARFFLHRNKTRENTSLKRFFKKLERVVRKIRGPVEKILMNISAAREVCRDPAKWRPIVSAHPNLKPRV